MVTLLDSISREPVSTFYSFALFLYTISIHYTDLYLEPYLISFSLASCHQHHERLQKAAPQPHRQEFQPPTSARRHPQRQKALAPLTKRHRQHAARRRKPHWQLHSRVSRRAKVQQLRQPKRSRLRGPHPGQMVRRLWRHAVVQPRRDGSGPGARPGRFPWHGAQCGVGADGRCAGGA